MDSQESIFIYLFKVPSCSIKGIYIFYWDLKMRMLWVSLTFAILKEESIFKSAPESYNKSPGLSFFFPFPIAYLQPPSPPSLSPRQFLHASLCPALSNSRLIVWLLGGLSRDPESSSSLGSASSLQGQELCISYLVLHNKLSPNLVTQNNNSYGSVCRFPEVRNLAQQGHLVHRIWGLSLSLELSKDHSPWLVRTSWALPCSLGFLSI